MTNDDKITDEKIHYDITRAAANISVLSSGKIDKYQYLTGEILPSNQMQIEELAKFTYYSSGKAFEKQTKTIKEKGRKQAHVIRNQNERLVGLTKRDDHKYDHKDLSKERFKKLVNKKFNKLENLTYEINHDDLTYYFNPSQDGPFRDYSRIGGKKASLLPKICQLYLT